MNKQSKELGYLKTEDPEKRSKRTNNLMIHWGVFIIANILLIAITYKTVYSFTWHSWILMGWGILLLLHTITVVYMNFRANTLESQLAVNGITTLVSSGYILWNDWAADKQLQWFGIVVIPMIILLINHLYLYRRLKKRSEKALNEPGTQGKANRFDRRVQREIAVIAPDFKGDPTETAHKIVINRVIMRNHILIYLLIHMILFAVGFIYNYTFDWFRWSSVSWGMMILFQSFIFLQEKNRSFGAKLAWQYFLVLPVSFGFYFYFVWGILGSENNWIYWISLPVVLLSLLIINRKTKKRLKEQVQGKTAPEAPKPEKKSAPGFVQRFERDSSATYQKKPQASSPGLKPVSPSSGKTLKSNFCPNCGMTLEANQTFCRNCGYRV